jgi:hypothetical protein
MSFGMAWLVRSIQNAIIRQIDYVANRTKHSQVIIRDILRVNLQTVNSKSLGRETVRTLIGIKDGNGTGQQARYVILAIKYVAVANA